MNELIKELAFKTGFISKKSNGDEWRWGYIDPELAEKLEQFAELIVQECADIAKHNVMNISTYADAEFVDEQIKEHFRS